MKCASAFARTLVLIYIFGLLSAAGGAQGLPGRVAGGASAPAQTTLAISSPKSFDTASEVLFGRGVRGPYSLSWKPVNQFTETLLVDGRIAQRDFDYEMDYASGVVTFSAPVSSRSMIRVEYSYDPSKAVRNKAPLSMPITLDLLKKENAGLQFTGLYKQADPGATSAADVAVFGLTGSTKAKEAEFSSTFLFTPELSDQEQGSTADRSRERDRSVVKLGGSTKTDTFRLSTSYTRVGEQFAGAKDYKLQQGSEAMDVAAVLTPTKSLSLSSSLKRTENLSGDKKGEESTTTAHSLVLSPEGAPRLTVARTEVEQQKPGTADRRVTTDKVELEHKLSPNLSAAATHENVTTGMRGSETRLTTNQVALDATPTDSLSIRSKLTRKDSSDDGGETSIGFDVEAAPTKRLNVKAAMSRVDSDKAGEASAESLKLVANPSKTLNVEMNLAHKDTDAAGDESARALKLSTTALRKTVVHLDWAEKDSEVKGGEEFGGIRVESSPTQAIKLSGALSQKETVDARDLSKEARIEVRPFSHTTLGGAYKEIETNGQIVSRVSEISASTKPVGYVELSGAYKSRDATVSDDPDSLNLALQLDTGGMVKLTGAYAANPEDKKGAIQRLTSQSYGLKSDFGRLKLKGAFTLKDEYLAGRQAETREIGLDYRLSANSLLTAAYSLDEYKEASLLETSMYTLGYSHRVGSRLNLYLGGRMTTYEKDQVMLQDKTEYEAEARLGVKF